MKKWLCVFMTVLMLFTSLAALAEEVIILDDDAQVEVQDDEEQLDAEVEIKDRTRREQFQKLIVGSTSVMTGNFFNDIMGGNNSPDLETESLLHGYNLVGWHNELGTYAVDSHIVNSSISATDGKGNKRYFVVIREDLLYSDGTPIMAKDYVFSVLLAASKQIAEIGGDNEKANAFIGYEAYHSGESDVFAGVRLMGDYEFAITVSNEYLPYFFELGYLNVVPYPIDVIAPGCVVKDDGKGAYIEGDFTAAVLEQTILSPETGYMTNPKVVSGPYYMEEYNAADHIANMYLNEYYIGDAEGHVPTIDLIIFRPIQSQTALGELKSGKLDLIANAADGNLIQAGIDATANGGVVMKNAMRPGLGMISFNCEQGPIQALAVRQALTMSLDRVNFADQLTKGFGMPVDGFYGLGQWMVQVVNGMLNPPIKENSKLSEEQQTAAWEELNLEGLTTYAFDLDSAKELLIQDGWTLDKDGKEYVSGIRYKKVGDELQGLDLTLTIPKNSPAANLFKTWQKQLNTIGIKLTVEPIAYTDLLDMLTGVTERTNHMFYLGLDFYTRFDPTIDYALQGAVETNVSHYEDEKLYELALDLKRTEPGDVMAYCKKWVAFQEYWTEVIPAIPLYTNVYFDFHNYRLLDYVMTAGVSWVESVLYADLTDAMYIQKDGTTQIIP